MIDLSGVKETNFEALEPGQYPVVVENAEIKQTKNGTGEYISVSLKVTDGDNIGRKLFTNFNIKNANPKAVEIGLSQLKTFLKAAKKQDVSKLSSVLELVGLKAIAAVTKETTEYGEQNRIKSYKPITAMNSSIASPDMF